MKRIHALFLFVLLVFAFAFVVEARCRSDLSRCVRDPYTGGLLRRSTCCANRNNVASCDYNGYHDHPCKDGFELSCTTNNWPWGGTLYRERTAKCGCPCAERGRAVFSWDPYAVPSHPYKAFIYTYETTSKGKQTCSKDKHVLECDGCKYTDKGKVVGNCGYTAQEACQEQQGTFLENACCTGSKSFSTTTGQVRCETKTLRFFGFSIGTKKRCHSVSGKTACFRGQPIPERGVAVPGKVYNVGGQFLGCGRTEELANITDDRLNTSLIQWQDACSIIDFGTSEALCTLDGTWEMVTVQEDTGKSYLAKRQPTITRAVAGTQKCCPVDKCWNGQACVNPGVEVELTSGKHVLCDLAT